ncbi:MAG: carboxypeptidase regulatory-like domain-containing protein [Acidobacteriota bacterium]
MRIAIGLAVAWLAWGQLPRPVEGTVVNGLTGEPLRRVSVQVMSAARPVEPVVTDALGRFRLPELPPGRYRLRATRAGFFPSEKGDASVEVTPGDGPAAVTIQLNPGAAVSGTVTDEAGAALPGAQITVLRRAYVGGRRKLVLAGGGVTDDRGQYRLHGLPAYSYIVRAAVQRLAGDPRLYPPTYYPAAAEPENALAVALGPGQEQRGVNISLRPGQSYRVSGRLVNGLTNTPLTNTALTLMNRGVGVAVLETGPQVLVRDPGGRFTVQGVVPGAYDLTGSYLEAGQMLQVRMRLEVSRDLDDVVVTMRPGVTVRGRVVLEGEGNLEMAALGVEIESDEDLVGGGGAARPGADGTFLIGPLLPGGYGAKVHRLPAGAYLRALRVGGREAALDLSGAAGQTVATEWVISLRGGRVEGGTTAGAVVVLVPAAGAANRRSRYRAGEADGAGRFVLPGVAPGSYLLYAFRNAEAGAWMDDEFLRGLPEAGVAVTVGERETKVADVKAQ